jgi:catechol 2,3-dioxygenase-like lactoylglutathione lyase family enzyme
MFDNASCNAVLPASDITRARTFWHDTFGLDPVEELESDALMYEINGTRVLVYATQFAGTAQNTAMAIETPDFDGDFAALRAKGVQFNDYDLPGVKTVDGVANWGDGQRGAWFNDSEGNIIAIGEQR